jgi:monoamine oxidase
MQLFNFHFMSKLPDVIVIGAGAAGLAAAAELGRAGLPVLLVEARSRIGGRIFTKRDPGTGIAVEFGAEFIHGRPSEIWNKLKSSGHQILESEGENWCYTNSQLTQCDFFAQVEEILSRMEAQGADESFRSFLNRCWPDSRLTTSEREAKERALAYIVGFNAADPDLVGVHWLLKGREADQRSDGNRIFRPEHGYQDLIDALQHDLQAHGVVVRKNTVVESITWRRGRVELTAREGTQLLELAAPCALVTLPLAVLQTKRGETGAVRFQPALPREKLDALTKLRMGQVLRVSLRFRYRFWSEPFWPDKRGADLSRLRFLFSDDGWFPTWWTLHPSEAPVLTGWAPFRCAERLSGKSESYIVDHCLRTLGRLFDMEPSRLNQILEAVYCHDWWQDPYARGAYSYGAVGSDGAAETLAAPLENTLYFAGEATDANGQSGTVHGAMASGLRAAREIVLARKMDAA